MIFQETKLPVIDNSGAKIVLCIRVIRTDIGPKNIGYTSSVIVVTIKHAVSKKFRSKKKNLHAGEIHKAIVAISMFSKYRKTGQYIIGPLNGCVILRQENPRLPLLIKNCINGTRFILNLKNIVY
jgi:ribosomal protein L14